MNPWLVYMVRVETSGIAGDLGFGSRPWMRGTIYNVALRSMKRGILQWEGVLYW